jgi:hypothetical protein
MNSTKRALNTLDHHIIDLIQTTMVDILDNEDAPETRIQAIVVLHDLRKSLMQKMDKVTG